MCKGGKWRCVRERRGGVREEMPAVGSRNGMNIMDTVRNREIRERCGSRWSV